MPAEDTSENLSNLLHEERRFPPSPEFAAQANVDASAYDEAAADRLAFWDKQADELEWSTRWSSTLEWEAPFAKWFVGGELNASVNCVDRHVAAGNGDRVAIHFEGEPGDTRTITYADLLAQVCQAANTLTSLGIAHGDRVAIYLPMLPEAVVSMLACARLGAAHSVIFGGFSAQAIYDRVVDAEAKVLITADGGYRRGSVFALKPIVDEALAKGPNTVEHVLVVKRGGNDVPMTDGRDLWWSDVVDSASTSHQAEPHESEHPLFILYTSGTTGKPKGILHTTGGFLTQAAYTHRAVFDLKPETDVYWCTADVGWVTGHSYIVYAPLANGATQVMYEGTPDTPHQGRWWEIVAKYGVTILYTAPTAIRTFMKWGEDIPAKFDLSSLRVLGSVGESINPEAWVWYRRVIGGDRTPIVDTWWQTETGGIMISPLPGVTATKPGSATRPLPGISADVVDNSGAMREKRQKVNAGAQRRRWPAGADRAVAGDAARHLGRSRPLRRDLLVPVLVAGLLLRRRRRQEGRGRRPLAARPGGRRHEYLRPPDLHDRGGVGTGVASHRCRGGRGGRERPDHRAGDRGVRHPAWLRPYRRSGHRRARQGAS